MIHPGPREAIIELITRPSNRKPSVDQASRPPVDVPSPAVASGDSGIRVTAVRPTIQFLKERSIPGRHLCAVRFDDEQEESWFWLVAAEHDSTGGWRATGVAGGSGQMPQRSEPWLNLAGSWGQGRLYLGGEIHTGGASIGEVRLMFSDGSELVDDAEADIALFLSDRVAEPDTVDIYDTDGQLLTTHAAF